MTLILQKLTYYYFLGTQTDQATVVVLHHSSVDLTEGGVQLSIAENKSGALMFSSSLAPAEGCVEAAELPLARAVGEEHKSREAALLVETQDSFSRCRLNSLFAICNPTYKYNFEHPLYRELIYEFKIISPHSSHNLHPEQTR